MPPSTSRVEDRSQSLQKKLEDAEDRILDLEFEKDAAKKSAEQVMQRLIAQEKELLALRGDLAVEKNRPVHRQRDLERDLEAKKQKIGDYKATIQRLEQAESKHAEAMRDLKRRNREEVARLQAEIQMASTIGRPMGAGQGHQPEAGKATEEAARGQASHAVTVTPMLSPIPDRDANGDYSCEKNLNCIPTPSSSNTVQNGSISMIFRKLHWLERLVISNQKNIDYCRGRMQRLQEEKERLCQPPDDSGKGKAARRQRCNELADALQKFEHTKPDWFDDPEERYWSDQVQCAMQAVEDVEQKATASPGQDFSASIKSLQDDYDTAAESCHDASRTIKTLNELMLNVSNSIQTHCRIRPRLDQIPKTEIHVVDDNRVQLIKLGKDVKGRETQQVNEFRFDGITRHDTPQKDLELEILPLCQLVLQGESVCIFCYGPTNSGKSYTMFGPRTKPRSSDQSEGGLIYAAAVELITQIRAGGQESRLELQGMEIYNNERDAGGDQKVKVITGEAQTDQAWDFVQEQRQKRHTSSTQCNTQSSRSHGGVTITVPRQGSGKDSKVGKMLLLDLAGTEPADASGNKWENRNINGDLLKRENRNINRDLLALRTVIRSLAVGEKPTYRGHTVTEYLKPWLKESKRVLSIIHVEEGSGYVSIKSTLEDAKDMSNAAGRDGSSSAKS